ncbi:MAG: organic solute transporter subunit alpha/Transmembrane protein [Olpidium bornovanus]|uniref:Organic solute transporter subunit alpha/Transmembrane protein n=1 Tax=Olpidium bornovanus TaxID=278681 RepID=A0A8H7ZU44_9FUNG|nr:MAG: organic solute transporter subunit alpha/Transmembrane protein [Olpidium bornovanus]
MGGGAGQSPGAEKLGAAAVHLAGTFAFVSTVISLAAIWLHLKNYRRPVLQRFVVRILLMTPIYAVISWLSLLSKSASFYLDIVRDVYEAFVMYSFFHLLVNYLGGEREMLTMLHGRSPTPHLCPVNLVWASWDVGDPYNFLAVKVRPKFCFASPALAELRCCRALPGWEARGETQAAGFRFAPHFRRVERDKQRGILQFVFFKPVLAIVIIILRATDSYQEGYISLTSGYFWTSFIYNISVSLCMYCLVIFFMTTKDDLKPYRWCPYSASADCLSSKA